jgi:hypothetical protein
MTVRDIPPHLRQIVARGLVQSTQQMRTTPQLARRSGREFCATCGCPCIPWPGRRERACARGYGLRHRRSNLSSHRTPGESECLN